jgi:pyruvate kinase
LEHIDDILEAADGIMVARGDLGVEIPIEQIALVQKQLIHRANRAGKPVITATQMLESMVDNWRPTRAESTDVANAVIDGTDCVMLSEESAMGKYPVEAVAMLAKIAATTEPHRSRPDLTETLRSRDKDGSVSVKDLIALSVETALERISPAAVFVPTRSGHTVRFIARFRPPVWIVAVSSQEATCQRLLFSRGVYPVYEPDHPKEWNSYVKGWVSNHALKGNLVILTEGPSAAHPETNHRMEIIQLENNAKNG